MTPQPPIQIGRYRIERELGRGSMGIVYEAQDTALGRKVALKTFGTMEAIAPHERKSFEQRFLSEARISATIEDEHVVGVYDVGRDSESGLLFMALEYVRGETLADALSRGPMRWTLAARLIAKVARALHTAHAQHIVHRDIKPANIMLNTAGQPKLMDFGIAKASASQLTIAGQVFGTPAYMSPEQASGEEVDSRSDIFSLGAVLYELLTNTRPFEGPTMAATLGRILRDEPRPASTIVDIPKPLDRIIGQALSKSREARYQSAALLAADLEDLLDRNAPRPAGETLRTARLPEPRPSRDGSRASESPAPSASSDADSRGGDAATAVPRRTGRLLLAAAIGAIALGAGALVFFQSRDKGGGEPVREASSEPLPTPAPGLAAAPAPMAPQPQGPPVTAPASSTAILSVSGAGQAARVSFNVRHPFASGSLRVKIDGGVIFADRISGLPVRSEGVTSGYDGRFGTDLFVPAGDHLVTVEIRSGSTELVESMRIELRSGESRRLMAVVDKTLTLTFE